MKAKLSTVVLLTGHLCSLIGMAAPPRQTAAQESTFMGMCNASAAVALDAQHFVVADDDDNVLRIYDRDVKVAAQPIQQLPLAEVFAGEIMDGDDLEIDLEGAATIGDKIFWIGSHSTSKKGNFRAARHRLFAMQITPNAAGTFVPVRAGKIYTTLLADLEKDHRFDKYKLQAAKAIKPKDVGGLSIEGLAATPDGALLIGFRNPLIGGAVKNGKLIGGKALVIPLLNPAEVIADKPARFGDPVELALGGHGIRSIESRGDEQYLIVAGPYHENLATAGQPREPSRLFLWSRKSGQLKPLDTIKLGELNIEAAFFYPHKQNQVQLLSDDGKPVCNGSFRSLLQKL